MTNQPPTKIIPQPAPSSASIVNKLNKPTPLNLYMSSRTTELQANGYTQDQIVKSCSMEYNAMCEEEIIPWVLLALKKKNFYIVRFIFLH